MTDLSECIVCGHRYLTCVCLECLGGFCSSKPTEEPADG